MIDSRETTAYEDGRDAGYAEGYEDAEEKYKAIIKSMAFELACIRTSDNYTIYEEDVENIMKEFGVG